ncbi:EAL domain-containing protein [Curvibacter sp. CHRR-16]|uniref:putative bifunctional diguanylate cyclase/phosphodiesterase n=1 Tax=Curvibacter sp. CHRR-16 TaxID=2835872 RepID=UPI001BD9CD06|nr:EAL domain-containing protein [Curvibacter sp. CHRR-16]MBT0569563.1 EAL domain-containing protein [Curvibacter sp. CHRR-16]
MLPQLQRLLGPSTAQHEAVRQRRLMQMALLVLVSFSGTAVLYGLRDRWDLVLPLTLTATLMLPVLWMVHHGMHQWGMQVMLMGVTIAISYMLWINEGLQDTVLLSYPVILSAAAQLMSPRRFWVLLACMLGCVLLIGLGTQYGWRSVQIPSTIDERITDSLTILIVNGFVIWFLSRDMQHAQLRLQRQLKRLQASERRMAYLAQHDSLTELPNRALACDLLERAMQRSSEEGYAPLALLFIDMDNFKEVNDTLGHSAGDEFLRCIAERLRSAVRESDIVARQGGDEFLVCLTDVVDDESVRHVAQQILHNMGQPLVLRGLSIVPSCSIGVALFPTHGRSFDELLRYADLAMYQAKEAGRNTYRIYDESIHSGINEHLHLISSLRQALLHNEFVLHYQPVFDLRSGHLVGAEALIRWQHPSLGLMAPGNFIATAEKSGLIIEIGQWVLENACRQMQTWRQAGCPPLLLSVNLSPVQFRRGNLPELVNNALLHSGLPAQLLELEVTESTLIEDVEGFIHILQQLKGLGLRIAVDDFGTGYSNLSSLQRFPVDKLKIDQSFVRRLLLGEKDVAMVRTIIHLAKSLELQVTAEGVEDMATHDMLRSLGCDMAQGYGLGKPKTAEQFAAFWHTYSLVQPHAARLH